MARDQRGDLRVLLGTKRIVVCFEDTGAEAKNRLYASHTKPEFKGRWDRNRTCNLRFWSLLPFVQGRSGTYTKALKSAHFDGPKCVEVHQRSPALGSKLGSNQPGTLMY
jgi:hypothetical protein